VVAMRERTAFPSQVLDRLPQLRLLVTTGMRNAAIDIGAAGERGVVVCGTTGKTNGTVELTWAFVLAWVRRVAENDRTVRAGGWQDLVVGDLEGERLGVVGLGRLGSRVAAVGQAFGMEVVAWSRNLTAERAAEHGVTAVAKGELFETSRVVSVHMVASPDTAGIVGAAELRAMRPDALLVNTSRAPLVDQQALRRALEEGWFDCAALDVFDEEPLPPGHWVRTSTRTLLSPHMGYVTEQGYRLMYSEAAQDIAAFLAGRPLRVLT
jgi:phosphoglycerate dehydrogenase-like enzyme